MQFYWQESYAIYYSTCLSKGVFYISNYEQLDFVDLARKKATILPEMKNLYSFISYLRMDYGGQTKILNFSIFILYAIPTPDIIGQKSLIMSKFSDVSDTWLLADSKFIFSDNYYDVNWAGNKYG